MTNENTKSLVEPPEQQEIAVYQFIAEETERLLPILRYYIQKAGLAKTYDQIADDAEDLLQDVVVQVLESPEKLKSVQSPQAWLLGIANNLIKERIRKANLQKKRFVAEAFEDGKLFDWLAEYGARMEDDIDGRIAFEEILSLVPDKDRPILRMIFGEQLSGEEVAQRLDIRPATARSRLHRVLNQIRQNGVVFDENENAKEGKTIKRQEERAKKKT